jgi:UrcA family protein
LAISNLRFHSSRNPPPSTPGNRDSSESDGGREYDHRHSLREKGSDLPDLMTEPITFTETLMNTSITKQTSHLLAALATCLLLFGGVRSAIAEEAPGAVSRTKAISLAGLDLSTLAGAQAARERVHQAVRTICSQLGDDLDLSHRATYLECVNKATANAKPHLDALLRRAGSVTTAANH